MISTSTTGIFGIFHAKHKYILVGGFNPFEKYERQNWIISPSFGVKIKKKIELPSPKQIYTLGPRCIFQPEKHKTQLDNHDWKYDSR